MNKQQRNPEDFGVITISQQIADLKQSLSSHQSPIGDWKGIKQDEYALYKRANARVLPKENCGKKPNQPA